MTIKDKLLPCLLVIPFASQWILPDGMESKLYVNILGLPIYIFNLCYIVYIWKYGGVNIPRVNYKNNNIYVYIKILLFCFILYEMLVAWTADQIGFIYKLLGNNMMVFAAIVYFLCPTNSATLDKTKYVIIPTAIIIALEVILFGLGILHYELDLGDQEFGGIIRINTTVGAATGTAVTLIFCGVLVASFYDLSSWLKWTLIGLITVSIFFTISRGSILVWCAFLCYIMYKEYFINVGLTKKIKYILLAVASILLLGHYGVFDPVIERQDVLSYSGDIDTGRGELKNKAISALENSEYIGIGWGETMCDKGLRDIKMNQPIGVHSYYYCLLAEVGVPGLLIFVFLLLIILLNLNYQLPLSVYVILLLLLTFSTEPIFTYGEFIFPAFFIISCSLKKYEE